MSSTGHVHTTAQVRPEELTRMRAKLLPPYKVILFNDDQNDMEYVVAVLLHLFSHLSQQEATQIMLTAHLTGSAVVVVCPQEHAEYYQERLVGYGLVATIEPD
ncbi:MAG TPA: ATP-dependent Clp protease adaptor ClpS [Ktedonobacteraceae bacterium]|jgi:ATP-dependent Clp protease adaptor protein ClpS